MGMIKAVVTGATGAMVVMEEAEEMMTRVEMMVMTETIEAVETICRGKVIEGEVPACSILALRTLAAWAQMS